MLSRIRRRTLMVIRLFENKTKVTVIRKIKWLHRYYLKQAYTNPFARKAIIRELEHCPQGRLLEQLVRILPKKYSHDRILLFVSEIVFQHYHRIKNVTGGGISSDDSPFPSPKFSVALPTRKLNNNDHNLPTLLYTMFIHAVCPSEFEVLLAVDEDDDLEYFAFIREVFGQKLNIRMITGAAGRGYGNLHLINSDLSRHMADTSGGILSISDDTRINKKSWDVDLFSLVATRSDEVYISHAIANSHALVNKDMCLSDFLSHLWEAGPRCFHPFLSSALIKGLRELTHDKSGWGVFGNSIMSDSFFDILAFIMEREYAINIIAPVCCVGYIGEQTISEHKEGGLWGESPVIRTGLSKLYNKTTIAEIKGIAALLSKRMKEASAA